MWDKRVWSSVDTQLGIYSITSRFESVIDDFKWDFKACRYENERFNCNRRSRALTKFYDLIMDWN